jgi:hypothetical protein
MTLFPGLLEGFFSGHMGLSEVLENPKEFFFSNKHPLLELLVLLHAIRAFSVVIPLSVQASDS